MQSIIILLVLEIILILILILVKRDKVLGEVKLRILEGDSLMLKFVLVLPEKAAEDVVNRELKVSVNGKESLNVLPGDSMQSDFYYGNNDDTVSGYLADIDVAGNKGDKSEFSFTLLDVIAPPAPGAIGMVVLEDNVEEPTDPEVQPEPEPEPQPEPEPEVQPDPEVQ